MPAVFLTLSVILPCAYDVALVERTAQSLTAAAPAERLREILVVDDGASPAVGAVCCGARVLRHEAPRGLAAARRTGAAAAAGDVLVFFDGPAKVGADFWRPIADHLASDARRVVAPALAALDVDAWAAGAAEPAQAYLGFDFAAVPTDDATDFSAVLPGGVFALRRTWWASLGGGAADVGAVDLSLRAWRCGGDVVHEPRWTVARAALAREAASARDVAAAARAHLGGWYDAKVPLYDAFARLAADPAPNATINAALATCGAPGPAPRDFEWFLHQFEHIYRDAGALPTEIFQLQHAATGRCLALPRRPWGSAGAATYVLALEPCDNRKRRNSGQWWHGSNRKKKGECCAGLRGWNSDQCLDGDATAAAAGALATATCDLSGLRRQAAGLAAQLGLTVGRNCAVVDGAALGLAKCERDPPPAAKWAKRFRKRPDEFKRLSLHAQMLWLSEVEDEEPPPAHVTEL